MEDGKEMKLGLEKEKAMLGKSFGQNVSRLVLGSQIADEKVLLLDLFPDKMVANFNMFCPGVKDRIGGKVHSTNVITP